MRSNVTGRPFPSPVRHRTVNTSTIGFPEYIAVLRSGFRELSVDTSVAESALGDHSTLSI